MTNRNNAAQAMTEKLWRSCVTAASLAPTTGSVVVESSTILAIDNVLSALRAEDVQAGDERAAFEAYVQKRFGGFAEPWDANAARYPHGPDQARWEAWRDGRAALASAPATSAKPVAKLRFGNGDGMPSILSWNSRPAGTYLVYDAPVAALASAPVADDVQAMLKDPAIVHTNMCRGIIAPITFDMLAHVLGDDATAAWLDSRRVSAPVAGEVVAWRVTHPRWPQTGWRDASREPAPSLNEVKQQDADLALELAYAAPQASEAVRIVFPAHLRRMWSGGEVQAWLDEHQGITPPKASASGRMKRYRKWQADQTQANKVGGDCSKGAGEASSPVAGVPHTALQLEDLSRQVERDLHRFGTNVHVGVPAGVLRSMLHTLHAPVAGEARKMLADEEALDGVAEWLNQHDLTVNVGAAIEPAQDVHIESSAGWLLRLLTELNSAPQASEAASAAAHDVLTERRRQVDPETPRPVACRPPAFQNNKSVEARSLDMGTEFRVADATYESRITRVSERNERDRSMYRMGWWDRAWNNASQPSQIRRMDCCDLRIGNSCSTVDETTDENQSNAIRRPSPYRDRTPLDGRTLYEQIRIKAYLLDWPDDAAHEAANYAVRWFGNDRCTSDQDLYLALSEALGGD